MKKKTKPRIRKVEKTVKAWAILDKENMGLARYSDGEYMISPNRTPRTKLHETYESIPCTITYQLPKSQ